jgi:hypothetical protein
MAMTPQLPPPDPHEPYHLGPARDVSLPGPVAVFVNGGTASERDRVADAILDMRPGLLVVCDGA